MCLRMKRTPPPSGNPLQPSDPTQDNTSSDPAEREGASDQAPNNKSTPATPPVSVAIPPILLESDEPSETPKVAAPKHAVSDWPVQSRFEGPALPESYGTGNLTLTARDPRSLYAHWDLSVEQQAHFSNLAQNGHLQIRVYRDNVGAQLVSEDRLAPQSHHSFIGVDTPAGKYVAELGYYPVNGPWKAIATSDATTTPSEVIAKEEPIHFATLSFASKPAEKTSAPMIDTPAVDVFSSPPPAKAPIEHDFPLPRPWRSAVAREPAVSHEPTAGGFAPQLRAIEQTGVPQGELVKRVIQEEPVKSRPWMAPAAAPEQEWTYEQERTLAELIGWRAVERTQLGSLEIEELIQAEGRPGEALPSEVTLPSESVPSSISLGEGPPAQPRDFWFSVNAELVIYGATEPNAVVTIAGRRIRLRPDGTFSYRFSLPDGSYELPIGARSSKGDERRAELSFYRGTRYGGHVGAVQQDPGLKPPLVGNVD